MVSLYSSRMTSSYLLNISPSARWTCHLKGVDQEQAVAAVIVVAGAALNNCPQILQREISVKGTLHGMYENIVKGTLSSDFLTVKCLKLILRI